MKTSFCCCKRFNLICFMRIISSIKWLYFKAGFQTVFVSNSLHFNLIMIRLIALKLTKKIANSYFLSYLIHFEHFLNKEERRHCFYFVTQRVQAIIVTIWLTKLIRSTRILLSSTLHKSIECVKVSKRSLKKKRIIL